MSATGEPALKKPKMAVAAGGAAAAQSWVPVAADSDFPLQNLPYGACAAWLRVAAAVVWRSIFC
jgi:hypothetical protein